MSELKKILNFHESWTHQRLNAACEEYGAAAYPKVRVADVIAIETPELSAEEKRFALQAHFDFVVADESHTPLIAVEFDGPLAWKAKAATAGHAQEHFLLLRINARHIHKKYRDLDLLSWCIHMWFIRRAIEDAQEAGSFPLEPVDPTLLLPTWKPEQISTVAFRRGSGQALQAPTIRAQFTILRHRRGLAPTLVARITELLGFAFRQKQL